MTAIEVTPDSPISAYQLSIDLMKNGVLCKPPHDNNLRLTPPLIVTSSQIEELGDIFEKIVAKY